MKYFTFLLLSCLLLCVINAQGQQEESTDKWNKDELAFELCQLYAIDQNIRNPEFLKLLGRKVITYDSITFSKFIKFVEEHGFPNKKLVGEDNWSHPCVNNVGFVYLAHNPDKVAKYYYNLFKTEITKGNLSPTLLSYALDRYYVSKEGRSFFDTPYKAWSSANGVCLQDKAKSDSLRMDIGLPPLPDSCFVDCSKIEIGKADYTKPIVLEIPK